jgi:hypothetical protein
MAGDSPLPGCPLQGRGRHRRHTATALAHPNETAISTSVNMEMRGVLFDDNKHREVIANICGSSRGYNQVP